MNNTWSAIVPALSGLLGAAVGGMGTYFSNKNVKLLEWKQSVRDKDIEKREELYKTYLAEASRLHLMAFDYYQEHSTPITARKELEKMNDLFGQIKLLSSLAVENAAFVLLDATRVFCGIIPLEEFKGEGKVLHEMATACRQELDALRATPL